MVRQKPYRINLNFGGHLASLVPVGSQGRLKQHQGAVHAAWLCATVRGDLQSRSDGRPHSGRAPLRTSPQAYDARAREWGRTLFEQRPPRPPQSESPSVLDQCHPAAPVTTRLSQTGMRIRLAPAAAYATAMHATSPEGGLTRVATWCLTLRPSPAVLAPGLRVVCRVQVSALQMAWRRGHVTPTTTATPPAAAASRPPPAAI